MLDARAIRWRASPIALAVALAAGVSPRAAAAANFTCSFTGAVTSDWITAGNWAGCNHAYPNDGGGNTYDVSVTAGPTATLSTGPAITVGNGTVTNSTLNVVSGANASFTGSVAVTSGYGQFAVDSFNGGGSSVNIGGNLVNASGGPFGSGGVVVGNAGMVQASTLAIGGTRANTGGTTDVTGGNTAGATGQIKVTGAVPSTLTGQYNIVGNAGGANITGAAGRSRRSGTGRAIWAGSILTAPTLLRRSPARPGRTARCRRSRRLPRTGSWTCATAPASRPATR